MRRVEQHPRSPGPNEQHLDAQNQKVTLRSLFIKTLDPVGTAHRHNNS